jgi:threonyl-tRNA synthetase
MAEAVKGLFPDARLAIGPAIEEGFYYDFEVSRPFTPEDLEKIEKKMQEIIKRDLPFVREEITKEDAIKLFQKLGEDYKIELINELNDATVSIYRQSDFVDLCRGPHVPSTGKIKAFKLLSTAGAYWRGSEKNKMLQRIYGASFPTKGELDAYLKKLEEIKKRDHRRLGKELDLFSINEDAGGGLILWHPKGAVIRKAIEDFWRDEHYRHGYELVFTPHIARLDLWRTSGHWDFYRENMYSPMMIEDMEYELKPMNCPFHIMIYKSHIRSYRSLPMKFAELGTVYRYERSGVLHGLLRVRGFTQDDAHIFCRPDQLEDEILKILDFTLYVLRTFGFSEYDIYLSTRPEKYVGAVENWERATDALRLALEKRGLKYEVDPGEGVFYGPKIDLKIKDMLGRAWQCTTIQVDFNLPERFEVSYVGEDNKPHQTIMIHRALMGSLERFFGVLIEHYAGAFPVWLSPVQTVVMTITDAQTEYARGIVELLKKDGVRVESDFRSEKIGFKIREAQLMKAPYMLIIGDKEVKAEAVAVRTRKGEDLGQMKTKEFLDKIKKEIAERAA